MWRRGLAAGTCFSPRICLYHNIPRAWGGSATEGALPTKLLLLLLLLLLLVLLQLQ